MMYCLHTKLLVHTSSLPSKAAYEPDIYISCAAHTGQKTLVVVSDAMLNGYGGDGYCCWLSVDYTSDHTPEITIYN